MTVKKTCDKECGQDSHHRLTKGLGVWLRPPEEQQRGRACPVWALPWRPHCWWQPAVPGSVAPGLAETALWDVLSKKHNTKTFSNYRFQLCCNHILTVCLTLINGDYARVWLCVSVSFFLCFCLCSQPTFVLPSLTKILKLIIYTNCKPYQSPCCRWYSPTPWTFLTSGDLH